MSTFHVTKNRVSLSSFLTPRYGYELSNGIACTFTLDFETILNVFYSLGMSDEIAVDNPAQAKLELLMGINRYADKLSFYCNDCAITPPRRQEQKIFASLIDKCIFEVDPKKAKGSLQNGIFHPKIWLLLYEPTQGAEKNDKPYIKLIVSSRNLAKSSNLDYAIAMEADVLNEKTKASEDRAEALTDWLEYLKQFTTSDKKREKLESLQETVARIDSFTWIDNAQTDVYSEYRIQPLGISEEYNKENLDLFDPKQDIDWLVVVSPFLGENFIKELTKRVINDSSLLTRRESLTPGIAEQFDKIYGLEPRLYNNEIIEESVASDSDADTESPEQDGVIRDIHAKMYIYTSDRQSKLLIGSANATDQAFNDNVEFMIQLDFRSRASYNQICSNLFQLENGELTAESPFIEIDPDEIDNKANNDEESFPFAERRKYGEKIESAEVLQDGDQYTIVIKPNGEFDKPVKIAPVNAEKNEIEFPTETQITGLSLNQLSNFYIITIENDRFIKIIDTKGIPVVQRDKSIVKSIVANKADFYKIVELILADDPVNVIAQRDFYSLNSAADSEEEKNEYIPESIYESALRLAALNLKPFEELQTLIKYLSEDEDKVDKQLLDMLDTFVKSLSGSKKQ